MLHSSLSSPSLILADLVNVAQPVYPCPHHLTQKNAEWPLEVAT